MLPDRLIGINDCLEMTGQGELLDVRPEHETKAGGGSGSHSYSLSAAPIAPYSRNYQWLPCEVEFSGLDDSVK